MLSAAIRMPTFLIAKPSNTCTSARALLPAVGALANFNLGGLAVLVVLETDELHQIRMTIPVGTQQPAGELQRNWFGERSWIFDGEDVFDAAPVRTGPALDRVQLLGVRGATAVEPELVVVADSIDHQRVTFPVADRMAPPVVHPVLRMRAPVHIDDAMRPGIARLVQDVDVRETCGLIFVSKLPRIRVHARHAHRQA